MAIASHWSHCACNECSEKKKPKEFPWPGCGTLTDGKIAALEMYVVQDATCDSCKGITECKKNCKYKSQSFMYGRMLARARAALRGEIPMHMDAER